VRVGRSRGVISKEKTDGESNCVLWKFAELHKVQPGSDPIDWQAAKQAPDASKWSTSPQSGNVIIDPSVAIFPLVANYGTATFPNQHGWSPGINGSLSGNFGYSGWGGGAG
jgi:hypothetical protein